MLRFGRDAKISRELSSLAHESLDCHVASQLFEPTTFIALSGSGLNSGRCAQSQGGLYICDRGSSHIRVQDELLSLEFARYGYSWDGIDPRMIAKEESEYEEADLIAVPSEFCYDTSVDQGIPPEKLLKITYGAHLDRFRPSEIPAHLNDTFTVLFVGSAGFPKGFIDLLRAFQILHHPGKRLILIGTIVPQAKELLASISLYSSVDILGVVGNAQLKDYYNRADVFVLSSIEEGLAMVLGEAMACGCPVVASTNTGAAELITNGVEGFIVPIHSPEAIAERLQLLADDAILRGRMAEAALARVQKLGGWDAYGDLWISSLKDSESLNKHTLRLPS